MKAVNNRLFWQKIILSLLKEKSVLWLQGVRRSGKTTLCQSLNDTEIFDCERPRHRKLFEDPESFFESVTSKQIAIDEIHRLDNASEVLKIAADYFPHIKIIATGSSTLHARKKFSDTLTDRKRNLWLTPINLEDMKVFSKLSLNDRLFKGGLPAYALKSDVSETDYQDWIDSYWAKDIQQLYNVENRTAFLKFFELLALQSGGLFEAQSFTPGCGVTRPTLMSYLSVLENTQITIILRPFFKNAEKEVIAAPKVYFFDTGFITYFNGWSELHLSERGHLWEHFILNELCSITHKDNIFYWRNKSKQEVDFVIKKKGKQPLAIECKWSENAFDPNGIESFRKIHPSGENLLICNDIERLQKKRIGKIEVTLCPPQKLREYLTLQLNKN